MMKRTVLLATAVLAASIAFEADAAGELMVHPTRVVLEGTKRTAQIDLMNSGTETTTYRISAVRRRMTETGTFVPVDTPSPDERFADEMIRFSPRQVVLRPGAAQAVRLQLRKPADLPDGEYRVHLMFQALPSAQKPVATGEAESSGEGIEIRLDPVYGASIPVIVRHGQTSASVALSELELRHPQGGPPSLSLTIARGGSRSIYGDVVVRHRTPQGVEKVVGRANGLAVYTPNRARRVVLPLTGLDHGIPAGELRVTFTERPEQKARVEAQARLPIR